MFTESEEETQIALEEEKSQAPKFATTKYLLRYPDWTEAGPLTKYKILQLCKDEIIDERFECAPYLFFGIISSRWQYIKTFPDFSDHVPKINRARRVQMTEEAKINPPLYANCYLRKNNIKEGPYTPMQIKTMWDAGTLLANTLYIYEGISAWTEVRGFCENQKWKGSSADKDSFLAEMVKEQKVTSNRVLWIGLMILTVFVVPALLLKSCSYIHGPS